MGQRLQRLSDSANARFERSLQTTLSSFFKTTTAATTNKQTLSEVGTTNVVSCCCRRRARCGVDDSLTRARYAGVADDA